ncbi:MAG TPA: PKD domain-containing protein, partial [Candidatus Dormibacteraeota bacterium]|nr:PKD domain-containing protein [Candidatus Dormibacteraeota bacterium]
VAPTAAITGVTGSYPLVTTSNELLTFGGSFSDPGKLDSHTATWNFGDGSSSVTAIPAGGSTSLSALHSYAGPGTYPVSLTVTDDDGGVGQASTTVTVQTTQQALAKISAYIQGLPLDGGRKQSLLAKLNAAGDAAARGDDMAAHNQLNAFLNEVSADLKTGKLTQAQADTLRGAVYAIQGTLGTYNRFLEWLLFAA